MKKAYSLTTVLVLTLFLMAGCGCRNSKPGATTVPTLNTMPTEQTTIATTMPTEASSAPTIQDGNGPVTTESTGGVDNSQTDGNQSRSGGMIGGSGTSGANGSTANNGTAGRSGISGSIGTNP